MTEPRDIVDVDCNDIRVERQKFLYTRNSLSEFRFHGRSLTFLDGQREIKIALGSVFISRDASVKPDGQNGVVSIGDRSDGAEYRVVSGFLGLKELGYWREQWMIGSRPE